VARRCTRRPAHLPIAARGVSPSSRRGDCSRCACGRRAADAPQTDARQTPRGSDAVPTRRPAADRVQLPAAPHAAPMRRCVAHLHHAKSRPHRNKGADSPSRERPLRQRQCQQHEERGRLFERPTSAMPGIDRRHAKFKFHLARIVRRTRARSRCSERRIRTPLARLPWLPNRRIAAALSCP
jgi:hypothetical protein